MLSSGRIHSLIDELANLLLLGIVSGGIAGAISGFGSRVAMRIVGMMAEGVERFRITDSGNRVGDITFGGTLTLVIFSMFLGIGGGLLYLAIRPYLPKRWHWSGLTFSILLLAIAGNLVIEGDNRDFRQFGATAVNVLLFTTLFPLFGLLLAYLVTRIEPLERLNISNTYLQIGMAGGLSLLFFIVMVMAIITLIDPGADSGMTRQNMVIIIGILGITGGGILMNVLARSKSLSANKSWLRSGFLTIVGGIALAGTYFNIDALIQIF